MVKHLLRTASVVSLVAVALALALPARAADKPEKEKAKRHQLTGVIESVDSKASMLKVKKGSETVELSCAANCKYSTKDKEMATIDDLKAGDKVMVIYGEEGGKNVAHKVGPAKGGEKEKPAK